MRTISFRTVMLFTAAITVLAAPALLAQGAGKLKFETYEDGKKEHRWRLKAANGEILATAGEGYKNKADCTKEIDQIKKDAGTDKMKFETAEDGKKEWRWQLKASNGKVVASSSESYKAKADCDKAMDLVKKGVKDATVVAAP